MCFPHLTLSPFVISSNFSLIIIAGRYFHPIAIEANPSPLVNVKNQKKLWEFSQDLVKASGYGKKSYIIQFGEEM